MNKYNVLLKIIGNRMMSDIQKSFIRCNYSSDVADSMCASIDGHEKEEHIKFLQEVCTEWRMNQLRQQTVLLQYFKSTDYIIVIRG
jgi:hypothetical protein